MIMSVENGLAPGWTGFLFVCYLFLVFCLERKKVKMLVGFVAEGHPVPSCFL